MLKEFILQQAAGTRQTFMVRRRYCPNTLGLMLDHVLLRVFIGFFQFNAGIRVY